MHTELHTAPQSALPTRLHHHTSTHRSLSSNAKFYLCLAAYTASLLAAGAYAAHADDRVALQAMQAAVDISVSTKGQAADKAVLALMDYVECVDKRGSACKAVRK
ncbi:hypothetical protein QBK99_25660 [Corticibacterium sp. UT-5YL-CI-8]|nr:hypothetical protein [Tianweitania sp. UT-5YL-CI-8]